MNTASKISFRKASPKDVGFLIDLRKKTMTEHLQNAGIYMDEQQHRARVLEHFDESNLILVDGLVAGVIKLGVLDLAIHIRQFQISPLYQNKGIGLQVVNLVKKKAQQKSLPVTLNVLIENPAKSLYLRAGFIIESSDQYQHFMRCAN